MHTQRRSALLTLVPDQRAAGAPPPALPTDIAARVRSGDARAFELLFRTHYASLCGFALRYTGQRALAEELVQELFTDLWTHRAEWDVRGSIRSYLFAAARNRALNLRRRQAVERDWAQEEAIDDVRELHPIPEPADRALEAAEARARLDAALESLPERCRLVMHLRWHEQMSYASIAQVMGISVKGVENQLGRGLKALREKLG
jgi:RNA polymerase sigma-19 factor, ECF subfamily